MSRFEFLKISWTSIYEYASKAENYVKSDPEGACHNARKSLEAIVNCIYDREDTLRAKRKSLRINNKDPLLGTLISQKEFRDIIGEKYFKKAEFIKNKGNDGSHYYNSLNWEKINLSDSRAVIENLYSLAQWFASRYGNYQVNDYDDNSFDEDICLDDDILEDIKQTENTLSLSNFKRDKKLKSGDYERVIADYNEAIRINPENYQSYFYRGQAKEELEDHEGAIEDYTEAIRIKPRNKILYTMRGHMLEIAKNYKAAIENYTEAIFASPNNNFAYFARGRLNFKLGNLKEAVSDIDQAINAYVIRCGKLDYYAGDYYKYLGDINKALKDNDAAIFNYSKAIEVKPDCYEAYFNRGLIKKSQGDRLGSLSDYGKSIEIRPDFAEAYYYCGLTHKSLGDKEKELSDYNKAIELKSDYADAYYSRALSLKSTDPKKALSDFKKASQLYQDQGNTKAHRDSANQIKKLDR